MPNSQHEAALAALIAEEESSPGGPELDGLVSEGGEADAHAPAESPAVAPEPSAAKVGADEVSVAMPANGSGGDVAAVSRLNERLRVHELLRQELIRRHEEEVKAEADRLKKAAEAAENEEKRLVSEMADWVHEVAGGDCGEPEPVVEIRSGHRSTTPPAPSAVGVVLGPDEEAERDDIEGWRRRALAAEAGREQPTVAHKVRKGFKSLKIRRADK